MQDDYNIEKIFEEIENELISSMRRTLWSHKEDEEAESFDWPQWQALKLKQMEDFKENNKEIFKSHSKDIDYFTKIQMKKQFREGASRTNKEAIKAGFIKKEDSQLGGSFFGLNDRKIKALIKSTRKDINDVKYATLRMANDQYRQIIYKAQVFANTGAKTVKQAIDMATKDFLAKGFNCIEYKNGSRHNIADYCDMAIRTANKRANLMGEGEMRKKLGNPLVYISKHGGACDKCSPWQGRVYIDNIWSGGTEKDGEYPLLSTAIEGGLFHPRCQHGSSTYYEEINKEPEEVTEALNNEHEDEYTQYLQRRKRQYERLALGSLDNENIEKYNNKVSELKNEIENDRIESNEDNNELSIPELIRKTAEKNGQTISVEARKFIEENIKEEDIVKQKLTKAPFSYKKSLDKIIVDPTHKDIKYYNIGESIIHEIIHMKDIRNKITENNFESLNNIIKKSKLYIKNNYSYFYNYLKKNGNNMAVCDIISALSNGKMVGDFGHSPEYWKDVIIINELSANILSASIVGNKAVDKLLEEIPPLKNFKKECENLWKV